MRKSKGIGVETEGVLKGVSIREGIWKVREGFYIKRFFGRDTGWG